MHSRGFDGVSIWFFTLIRGKANDSFPLHQSSLYNQPTVTDQARVRGTGSEPVITPHGNGKPTVGSALGHLSLGFSSQRSVCLYRTAFPKYHSSPHLQRLTPAGSESNLFSLSTQISSYTGMLRDEKLFNFSSLTQWFNILFGTFPPSGLKIKILSTSEIMIKAL